VWWSEKDGRCGGRRACIALPALANCLGPRRTSKHHIKHRYFPGEQTRHSHKSYQLDQAELCFGLVRFFSRAHAVGDGYRKCALEVSSTSDETYLGAQPASRMAADLTSCRRLHTILPLSNRIMLFHTVATILTSCTRLIANFNVIQISSCMVT
jgi:hypothetical protein